MVGVEHLEFMKGFFLAGEQLDHRHTGNRLAQVRVDARDSFADQPVRLARLDAKEVDGECHRRDQSQRH